MTNETEIVRQTRIDLTHTEVTEDDLRPHVAPLGQCGYCKSTLGNEHEPDCVCKTRPVLVELKAIADSDSIAMKKGCCDSCERTDAEFVREATDERSWIVPDYAKQVGGSPSRVTFLLPAVDGELI